MSHLKPIYAVWNDNAEALAADIGELGVTVRQWRNRGNIPSQYWPKIIQAAALKGQLLEWTQFVPPGEQTEEVAAA
jgi:hypothetical protein